MAPDYLGGTDPVYWGLTTNLILSLRVCVYTVCISMSYLHKKIKGFTIQEPNTSPLSGSIALCQIP